MQKLARALYSAALWTVQPLLRRKLAQRAKSEPLYGEHLPERFGYYSAPAPQALVWIHAVSLGETRAAAVLIEQLRAAVPGICLLLTHGTATGRAEGAKLLRNGDLQAWLPWDTPGAVTRFFDHFQLRLGIIMETELWPNLCMAASSRAVPLVLANARLNEKSMRKAQRLAWLARPAYRTLSQVWAQTQEDAQRLEAVGAQRVSVLGNLKYDATLAQPLLLQGRQWRSQLHSPVILLASTREGEEVLFLQQIQALAQSNIAGAAINNVADSSVKPAVQWLIVPRHPQRFDEVAQMITHAGLTLSRRSQWTDAPQAADVWLGDSLAEMALYYSLADVALLGGSFAPLGGQNLIEAIAAACPVVMGPHTFNFADAAQTAIEQHAAVRVPDVAQGLQIAMHLAADKAQSEAMRAAGVRWLSSSRGAAQRMAHRVVQLLAKPSGH